jgi:hypothetical protein
MWNNGTPILVPSNAPHGEVTMMTGRFAAAAKETNVVLIKTNHPC